MNVVDSSAWLEYFAGGPNAAYFAAAIESGSRLIVPTICMAEVFKRVYQLSGRYPAYKVHTHMRNGLVVELDRQLAIAAAKIGLQEKLALADSIVLATARLHSATLWTQDADFQGIEGVKYKAKIQS